MTVVVTRNASGRVRGFLASCMLELAPGVYTSPRMTPAVRNRVWAVLEDWFEGETETGIVMTWREHTLPSGQGLRILGDPQTELVDADGVILGRREFFPRFTGRRMKPDPSNDL